MDVVRGSRSGLLLELKAPALHPGLVRDVTTALSRVPDYLGDAIREGRLIIESFSQAAIRECRDFRPDIPLGLLGTPPSADLPALATWLDQVNPGHRTVGSAYVAAVHAAGLDCLVWTVDRPDAMARALDAGVDGVITNRPDVLRRVLDDRVRAAAAPA